MARQKLGQHFLVKGSVLERIARVACEPGEPLVVEIGPGKGALTLRLLARAARVVAVELDPALALHLEQRFAGEPRLEIVQADALTVDLAKWAPAVVAGNLPYYVATPIMERILRLGPGFPRAAFLVQNEVARRLTAQPGSRDYGFLSVLAWVYSEAELLFDVEPSAFRPPPKVNSSLVRFRMRAQPVVPEPDKFLAFAGQCFRHKRKTLRNNLAPVYGRSVDGWSEAGLRAEQLAPQRLVELFHRVLPAVPSNQGGAAG